MGEDTTGRTLGVSLVICLACSVAVSTSTALLRPIRLEHERSAQRERVRQVLARQPGIGGLVGDLDAATLDEWVIDLATGARVPGLDPATFDPTAAANDPEQGRVVPPATDLARIQRQARRAVVTVARRGGPAGPVVAVVLPVYGRGYASLIHGAVAVGPDANTILGLTIGQHGETPGIGSEIEGEEWRALWSGKRIRDERGEVGVIVSFDAPAPDRAAFHVDAITGATRSSVGVGNMVRFWLGDGGFGPFLARVKRGDLE